MPFSARLARDHLWTKEHTDRVVGEYRRFLYLAATEAQMVTPSEDVDEAWHLHLAYTRSYWDDLCGKILTQPLHHDPTGGNEDEAGFRRAYASTLERYQAVFGGPAPLDVWPSVAERFSLDGGFRTVPLRDFHLAGRMWRMEMDAIYAMAMFVLAVIMVVVLTAVGVPGWQLALVMAFWAIPAVLVLARLNRTVALPVWGVPGVGFAKYSRPPDDSGSGGCGGCGGCGG